MSTDYSRVAAPKGVYLLWVWFFATISVVIAFHTQEPQISNHWNRTWNYSIYNLINLYSVDVETYHVDMDSISNVSIAHLHSYNKSVSCYINFGTVWNYTSDIDLFTPNMLGNLGDNWQEYYVNITDMDVKYIMFKRLEAAKLKGCDSIDTDNVDIYRKDIEYQTSHKKSSISGSRLSKSPISREDKVSIRRERFLPHDIGGSGFNLTYNDQVIYNRWIADTAHAFGMKITLKNDLDQIVDLLPYFDGIISEECEKYDECDKMTPFVIANKPVFGVIYNMTDKAGCERMNQMNFNFILKEPGLKSVPFCSCLTMQCVRKSNIKTEL